MKNFLSIFFKGFLMGTADLVPGFSGGTVAFFLGIYDRLLGAIGQISKQFPLVFKGKIRAFFQAIDGFFLISLLSGILSAIFVLSRLIHFLLNHYAVFLYAFFFGLILASAFLMLKKHPLQQPKDFLFFLIGLFGVLSWLFTGALEVEQPSVLYFFCAAALAICAMILPGISGTFILLILGVYDPVLEAVKTLDFKILIPFALGAGLGLIGFARLLHFLLQKHEKPIWFVLIGFLIGGLWKIWPFQKVTQFRINSKGEETAFLTQNVLPWEYQDPVLFQTMPIFVFFALVLFLLFLGFWALKTFYKNQ